jgi:ferredoxin
MPARIGHSLTEAARDFGYETLRSPCEGTKAAITQHTTAGGWDEPTFGEGAYCSHCMVILPQDKVGLVKSPTFDEKDRLLDYPFQNEVGPSTRLGCRVMITKEMDGMVVFVPDGAEMEST